MFAGIGPKPNTFSYAELRTATEDFNPSNKLGEGGFGPVYKVIQFDFSFFFFFFNKKMDYGFELEAHSTIKLRIMVVLYSG